MKSLIILLDMALGLVVLGFELAKPDPDCVSKVKIRPGLNQAQTWLCYGLA
jgi:hypothetical protein